MKAIALVFVFLLLNIEEAPGQVSTATGLDTSDGTLRVVSSPLGATAAHSRRFDALASELTSQEAAVAWWLHAGVGWAALGESLAATGTVGGSWQRGTTVYSLRGALTEEFNLFGGESLQLYDIALLYGWGTRPGVAHASAGLGVAWVGGKRPAENSGEEARSVSTIGFPLEVQLSLRPFSFLGLGIYGFANANPEEHFAGATLSVQLGRPR